MTDIELEGLLGPGPTEAELAQRAFMRDLNKRYIEGDLALRKAKLANSRSGFGSLSYTSESKRLDFDERLFQFALSRDLPLDGNWQSYAMMVAASEHPEIDPTRRKRGRPRKGEEQQGLLAAAFEDAISAQNDARAIEAIEHTRELLRRNKRTGSQKQALRLLLAHARPNLEPGSNIFEAEFKNLEKKVGAARKRVGNSLNSGRKPKNNAAK